MRARDQLADLDRNSCPVPILLSVVTKESPMVRTRIDHHDREESGFGQLGLGDRHFYKRGAQLFEFANGSLGRLLGHPRCLRVDHVRPFDAYPSAAYTAVEFANVVPRPDI